MIETIIHLRQTLHQRTNHHQSACEVSTHLLLHTPKPVMEYEGEDQLSPPWKTQVIPRLPLDDAGFIYGGLVDLSGQFSNLTSGLKELVKARSQMLKKQLPRSEEPEITASRGQIRPNWEKVKPR